MAFLFLVSATLLLTFRTATNPEPVWEAIAVLAWCACTGWAMAEGYRNANH